MKTLHRYLLRQVIASLTMAVFVFTFVLLLVSVLREILPMLMKGQGAFLLVGKAILLVIPFLLSFALPMAMLTATLLVFGRFSADQELTAARASGISLASLVFPILLLSLALCGVSAWMNLEVAPRCRVKYKDLRTDLKLALVNAELPERRYVKDFPGYIVYVGKNRKEKLEDILLFKLADDTNTEATIHAPTGHLEKDPANQRLLLHLDNASGIWSGRIWSGNETTITLDFKSAEKKQGTPDISDMTYGELQAEIRDLERRMHQAPVLDRTPDDEPRKKPRGQKISGDISEPLRVQLHKSIALSFACFGFTLIGIPLGIRVQRRETNINILVTLGLLGLYYMLVSVAQALQTHPQYAPHLLIWLPNFLFQSVGAVLLWRANRGI